MFWVFRVKNHDFTPKKLIFSNFRGGGRARPLLDPPLVYNIHSTFFCTCSSPRENPNYRKTRHNFSIVRMQSLRQLWGTIHMYARLYLISRLRICVRDLRQKNIISSPDLKCHYNNNAPMYLCDLIPPSIQSTTELNITIYLPLIIS